MLLQLIVAIVALGLILTWLFWPGGAWAQMKDSITGIEKKIDETQLKGITATNDGVIFSKSLDIDAREAFTKFIHMTHPSVDQAPCLVLFSFDDEKAWTVVNNNRKDDEFILHMMEKSDGKWVYLTDRELRARARFSEAGGAPCIMTANAAKDLKKCLDSNFEECEKNQFSSVGELLIHGRDLEQIEVPEIKKTLKNDFIEYDWRRVWVMYFDGANVCFVPNGGSVEGNENGLKKSVIEDYLKNPNRKICKVVDT
jgi:hypothetical protein